METVNIFISYVRNSELDYRCLLQLKKHLASLEHEGLINIWHGQTRKKIDDEEHEIQVHFSDADLFLILLSPDYIDSKYCYVYELGWSLDRHEAPSAVVIPIIARSCNWKSSKSLAELQPLPRNGRPITTSDVTRRDAVLASIAKDITEVVYQLLDGEIHLAPSEMIPLGRLRFEDSLVREQLARDMEPRRDKPFQPDRHQDTSMFLVAPPKRQPALMPRPNKQKITSTSIRNRSNSSKGASQRGNEQQLAEEATISWIKPLPGRHKNPRPKSLHERAFIWRKNAKLEYRACFHTILIWLTILLSIFDLGFFFFTIVNWLKLSQGTVIISAFLLTLGIFNANNLLAILLAGIYCAFWSRVFQIQFAWPAINVFAFGVGIFLGHVLLFIKHPWLYSQRSKRKWWILW